MSIFLQAAIGAVPALLLLIVYMAVRRRGIVAGLVATLVVSGFLGTMGYLHVTKTDFLAQAKTLRGSAEEVMRQGVEQICELFYGSIALEQEEMAEAYLSEIEASGAVEEQTLYLMKARMAATKGEWKRAKGYYVKAAELVPTAEREAFQTLDGYSTVDEGLEQFLDAGSEYQTQISEKKEAKEQYASVLQEQIHQEVGEAATEAEELIGLLAEIDQAYEQFLRDEMFLPTETVEELRKSIQSKAKDGGLNRLPSVVRAYIKIQVISENYKMLGRNLETSALDQILVYSELWRNGHVTNGQLPSDLFDAQLEAVDVVKEQVSTIVREQLSDESKQVVADAKRYLRELSEMEDNPGLGLFRTLLLEYLEYAHVSEYSRIYLQLAKLEKDLGNETQMKDYLDLAVKHAASSDSEEVRLALGEISDVIRDKDNAEAIQNVPGATENMAEGQYGVPLPDHLKNPAEDGGNVDNSGEEEFQNAIVDYVSKKRVAINIDSVDTSEFKKIEAIISIDEDLAYTEAAVKNMLRVEDCGLDIKNFTVKKLEYEEIHIVLCCDVSGSMEGSPMDDLKQAVRLFVNHMDKDEKVGIVKFDHQIKATYEIGSTKEELLAAADGFYADGGTAIFNAAEASLGLFAPDSEKVINCVILLSDGQDGNRGSASDIVALGERYASQNALLYTIGLGSGVDAGYLSQLADATGGSYLFVNDSATLSSFYAYLQAQLKNKYVVTFEAEDTLTAERELTISIKDGDASSMDNYRYHLEVIEGEEEETEVSGTIRDCIVTGLSRQSISKSDKNREVYVIGEGFEAGDTLRVTLNNGTTQRDLKVAYESETQLKLTVSREIEEGTYDVNVYINGERAFLKNGLTIIGELEELTFGPYHFKAAKIEASNSDTRFTLTGGVTMNDWLYFSGEVILEGDLNGYSITLYDYSGSYIPFDKTTSTGLAKLLADRGRSSALPALSGIRLYNDTNVSSDSTEYPVGEYITGELTMSSTLAFTSPTISLYPGLAFVDANGFQCVPEGLTRLLAEQTFPYNLFAFSTSVEGFISSTCIDFKIDIESKEVDEEDIARIAKLGNLNFTYSQEGWEVHLDTMKGELEFEIPINFFLLDKDPVKLRIKANTMNNNFGVDEFEVTYGGEYDSMIGTVPVVYTDFKAYCKNLNDGKGFATKTIGGGVTIETGKLSQLLPGIEDYIHDNALLSAECDINTQLMAANLAAKVTGKFLEEITIAEIELKAGDIVIDSNVLGFDNKKTFGVSASLKTGFIYEGNKNSKVDVSGKLALYGTGAFFGLTGTTNIDIDIKWWILVADYKSKSEVAFGLAESENGNMIFVLNCKNTEGKKGISIFWDPTKQKLKKKNI